MASSISFWQVLVSVHWPFWRVLEKNGFPHYCSYMYIFLYITIKNVSPIFKKWIQVKNGLALKSEMNIDNDESPVKIKKGRGNGPKSKRKNIIQSNVSCECDRKILKGRNIHILYDYAVNILLFIVMTVYRI